MCRNTVPTLRVMQVWIRNENGRPVPASYTLQQQNEYGDWKNIPVINQWPEPEQLELPLENRPSS